MIGTTEIIAIATSMGPVAGLFVLLFLSLFVWTMKENAKREEKSEAREARLLAIIEAQSKTLDAQNKVLEVMNKNGEAHTKLLEGACEVLDCVRRTVDELAITQRVNARLAVEDRQQKEDDRRADMKGR